MGERHDQVDAVSVEVRRKKPRGRRDRKADESELVD